MNKTTLATFTLLTTILTAFIAIGITPDPFATPTINPLNGTYYECISDNTISWTEAKAAAESRTYNGVNGHLVTITSASENTFVGNLVPGNSHSWIDLTDEAVEGQYKWVTGEPFDYTNWALIQPTGLNENYIELVADGRWNDVSNNDTHITGYIVEYSD